MIRMLGLRATGIGLIVLLLTAWELIVRLGSWTPPSIPSLSASIAALGGAGSPTERCRWRWERHSRGCWSVTPSRSS